VSRSVELWVGKTDDAVAPPRVRARVFEAKQGRCHKCGRKIGPADKWTLEHLIAISNGGRNAEDNLDVTCDWCLPIKNAGDASIKKHGTQVRYRHMGIKAKSGRPLAGTRSSGVRKRMSGKVESW
jgi:5-methylcytosine-specific restriction protein A